MILWYHKKIYGNIDLKISQPCSMPWNIMYIFIYMYAHYSIKIKLYSGSSALLKQNNNQDK